MYTDDFIADVLEDFLRDGQWPLVRVLQAERGTRISVRAVAAEAGRELVVCQEGADGRCFLTLDCLEKLPEAAAVLDQFARAVGFIAERFAIRGAVAVNHAEIGTALGLSDLELKRVAALLHQLSRLWVSRSWDEEGNDVSVTPSEDTAFFRGISTFAEFQEGRKQLQRNDDAITAALSREYQARQGVPAPVLEAETVSRFKLLDPALDAFLRQSLDELTTVHNIGAWRSAAIVAGSCLETVLLDICWEHGGECLEKWRDKWPDGIGADDMTKFAAAKGWITRDHADLSGVLRRWRNTVHPAAALKREEPTKELADALVANLRLMLADLRRAGRR